MIRISNVTKTFSNYKAVNDITLDVKPGEIFGFLGPNGAGKTTTIKMLAGLLKPDTGRISIGRYNMTTQPLQCKNISGYIPDRPYLYEKLTGIEFLQFIASLYQISKEQFIQNSSRFLKLFDLTEWRHNLIESYSHGMRQKLIISSVFTLEPPLIIVDEPMVGLDPKSARIVKELFKGHSRNGGTIFLSTHSLEIAEELCDRLAIIIQGSIKSIGTLAMLKDESRLNDSGLEDIFLELTGAHELTGIIAALRQDK